jgi:hypothetical protein
LAGLMLVLFSISITPKKIFHDLFANHKDTYTKYSLVNSDSQVSDPGINCHFDNLVVVAPYINTDISVDIAPLLFFPEQKINATASFHSVHQLFFGLRGPPSLS